MLGRLLSLRDRIKVEQIVVSSDENTVIVKIVTRDKSQAEELEKELNELVRLLHRWLL